MANPTNYYVDPAGNANSGTGSIGDPFLDLQYALNTVTRDATNGNQFNIKAGTDEVLAAALSLATYGNPGTTSPLVIRGYTATANDGGIGGISGAATYSIWNGAQDNISFIDLHLHNCGAANIVDGETSASLRLSVIHCEIDDTTGHGLVGAATAVFRDNYIHNVGNYGIRLIGSDCVIKNNFLKNGTNKFVIAIALGGGTSGVKIENNIISIDGTSIGINPIGYAPQIEGNSIYSAGGTGKGILVNTAADAVGITLINNIVQGFSGSGGVGISAPVASILNLYGNNKCYNNATNFSIVGRVLSDLGNNDTLLASPFTNPAGDDFSVSTAVKATAYPSSFYGSNTNNYLDPGAAQRQEAGGGRRNRARYHGV